jgi:hypothetical protein
MGMVWAFLLYEFKLTLRSLPFRVFAVIAGIMQIAAVTLMYLTPYFSNWGVRAIPSSIPYTAVLIFNTVVSIGCILISTEFLNRDLKLNSASSVFYRDFPTPLYFVGKGFGILLAMLSLELVILLIPFIVNMFFISDTPTLFSMYFVYPLILTIPLLLFTIGLSWLLMLLLKSQPMAFMFSIVILAAGMWLNRLTGFHQITDFPGIRIPALYGDFSGFGGTGTLLLQRGIIAALGIAFMASVPPLLPRLSQSKRASLMSEGFALVLAVVAIVLSCAFIQNFAVSKTLRDDMRALNREYGSRPRITMTGCDISVRHTGETITASAAVTIENNTGAPIDTYLFSLNPALVVETVSSGAGTLTFSRNRHIIVITPRVSLAPGASDSLVINYAGTIDDDACYLDTPESEREIGFPLAFMTARRIYGTISPDCVFLTPETLWYPVAGVPYGSAFPVLGQKDFPRFSLTISPNHGLTAVSQGVPDTLADGRTCFRPSTPLPNISLAIADYETKTTVVDSITYSVYYLKGHDFFSSYLTDIGDGLPTFIKQQQQQFVSQYYHSYPFDYFMLVEAPLQFYPCSRNFTVVQDIIQPGIVFVGEKGIYGNDLKQLQTSLKQIAQQNKGYEAEIQRMFLSNAIRPYISESYDTNQSTRSSLSRIPLFSLNTLYRIVLIQNNIVFNVFPNYYTFYNHLNSPRWPIVDTMMERYLALRSRTSSSYSSIGGDSFSPVDTANMLLAKHSLPEILSTENKPGVVSAVMSVKMNQLFAAFRAAAGNDVFDDKIREAFLNTKYSSVDFTTFLTSLGDIVPKDIETYLDKWYQAKDLPICRMCGISQYEIDSKNQAQYQLNVTLENPGTGDGIFMLSGRTLDPNGQGGRVTYESFTRSVSVPAGETRRVSILSDNTFYRQLTVNTYVSQNLPSSFTILVPDPIKDGSVTLFDGVLTVDNVPKRSDDGVIIVDDSDSGCVIDTKDSSPLFQKLLNRIRNTDTEFTPLDFFNPINKWSKTYDGAFFGDYIRSGVFKKPGNGTQPVIWRANIAENGTYDVFTHLSSSLGQQNYTIIVRGETKPRPMVGVFHYTVRHDDGASKIDIDTSQSEEWAYLGSFYFSAGEAVVELSDKSDGRVIYADAIKWERRDPGADRKTIQTPATDVPAKISVMGVSPTGTIEVKTRR